MSYAVSLIDRTKDFLPKKTDYALCKALNITYSNLKDIREGRGFFGQKQRVRIHEITGIPLEEITAMLEHDRAKNEIDKDFWEKRLPRISAACVIALSAFVAFHGYQGTITEAISGFAFVSPTIHYAKLCVIE